MRADGLAHGAHDLRADRAVVEELDVLGPRDRDQHEQPRLGEQVHEPARRHVVDAQEVDAEVAHEREVGAHACRRAEELARRIGMERPVGDALEEKFLVSAKEKLRVDADAFGNGGSKGSGRHLGRQSGRIRRCGYSC